MARLLDQVVRGLIAVQAVAGAVVVAAEVLAARIDPLRRRAQRPAQFGAAETLGRAVEVREAEVAGVADAGEAGAPGTLQFLQRPAAVLGAQFLPASVLDRDHQVRIDADGAAPDAGQQRVAGAVELVARRRGLEAVEVVPGDEVGDAADRVRAVDGARALLQHLHPAEGDGGDHVDVDEAPADQPRRHVDLAAAVDQHQRPRRAEAAQVDVGDALHDGAALAGVVPAGALADHAVAGAEVADQVGEAWRALVGQVVAVGDIDRVRFVDRRLLDRGADHGDLFWFGVFPALPVLRARGRAQRERQGGKHKLPETRVHKVGNPLKS